MDVFGQILQPHKVFECPGISTYMYIIESFGIKIAQMCCKKKESEFATTMSKNGWHGVN